jgi:hypothetical protein
VNIKTEPASPEALAMLKALQEAVTSSLERKRKLGQYAVIWHDGQPVLLQGAAKKPID